MKSLESSQDLTSWLALSSRAVEDVITTHKNDDPIKSGQIFRLQSHKEVQNGPTRQDDILVVQIRPSGFQIAPQVLISEDPAISTD